MVVCYDIAVFGQNDAGTSAYAFRSLYALALLSIAVAEKVAEEVLKKRVRILNSLCLATSNDLDVYYRVTALSAATVRSAGFDGTALAAIAGDWRPKVKARTHNGRYLRVIYRNRLFDFTDREFTIYDNRVYTKALAFRHFFVSFNTNARLNHINC